MKKIKLIATVLLLFCALQQLVAQSVERLITVSFTNIPLSEAIKKIESVSNYTFVYDANKINLKQNVSLSIKDAAIKKVLQLMLEPTKPHF